MVEFIMCLGQCVRWHIIMMENILMIFTSLKLWDFYLLTKNITKKIVSQTSNLSFRMSGGYT